MALTPWLAEGGKAAHDFLASGETRASLRGSLSDYGVPESVQDLPGSGSGGSFEAPWGPDPVVVCGFGPVGQVCANMLASPLASVDGSIVGLDQRYPYVAFDLDLVSQGQGKGAPEAAAPICPIGDVNSLPPAATEGAGRRGLLDFVHNRTGPGVFFFFHAEPGADGS